MVRVLVVVFACVGLVQCSMLGTDPLHRAASARSGPVGIPGLKVPTEGTIEQLLDHFDTNEERTWLQRYYESDAHYIEGGPLFVMIGFEGTSGANPASWLEGGHMMELAEAFQAKTFYLEQRFYGDSKPTEDTSMENLLYFTDEQSLADISVFINEQRALHPGVKVILFGGSVGGNLASWARLKFPDMVDGAVASSAPVFSQLNYPEYFEQVGLVMQQADPACLTDMRDAIQATADLFVAENGTEIMAELFNMCAPINATNKMDIWNFNLIYGDIYALEVQQMRSIDDVLVYCDYITNTKYGATPLDRLVQLTETFFPGFLPCAEIRYNPYRVIYSNPSWTGPMTATRRRQMVYQTCAWHADFTTSESPIQPFGDVFRSDVFLQVCQDYFDDSWDIPRVEETVANNNALYGGLEPAVTNAVYIQGSFDPKRFLGVREDISATATAIVIDGASYLTDMQTSDANDSPQLTEARNQIKQLVAQWLV